MPSREYYRSSSRIKRSSSSRALSDQRRARRRLSSRWCQTANWLSEAPSARGALLEPGAWSNAMTGRRGWDCPTLSRASNLNLSKYLLCRLHLRCSSIDAVHGNVGASCEFELACMCDINVVSLRWPQVRRPLCGQAMQASPCLARRILVGPPGITQGCGRSCPQPDGTCGLRPTPGPLDPAASILCVNILGCEAVAE